MWLVRSLTISLAIVLTIIAPTNSFTIRHRNASDLVAEDSTVVEVKYETPDEINTPREDEPVTVIPIQRNTEAITAKDDPGVTEADQEATERTSVDKVPTEGTESITTDDVVQTVGGITQKDWFDTTVLLETEKVENDTETSPSANYTSPSPKIILHSTELDNIISAVEQQSISSSAPVTLTERGTTLVATTDEENITTEEETTNTEPVPTVSVSMSNPIQIQTTDTTTTTEQIPQTDTTETTPFWKKYTNIERIRTTNTDADEKVEISPTERVADSINAHSTQARVSLEKAFELAPDILSLQQLKTHLMKTTKAIGYRDGLETSNSIDGQTESILPSTVGRATAEQTMGRVTEEGNQLEMVSKRAGYLDHSKTTIFTDSSTIANASRDGLIELDVIGYEVDTDSFGTGNKTSQSQLAEDAMKEELLKESFINDKEETSMLYRTSDEAKNQFTDVTTLKSITEPIQKELTMEQKVTNKLPEQTTTDKPLESKVKDTSEQKVTVGLSQQKVTDNLLEPQVSNYLSEQTESYKKQQFTTENPWQGRVTEDLSVKPISPEKKVTINLYTVNPNYKPLKKLEIQPPKSFTRDPDDNSWRNESLSSLGIVFKAKNSSKAFTEVLKNKTEVVMNNLPDQNRTVEKVELRDRLEKIAEKRKSKKKKTDQFGNIEYTDYEENTNSGDLHTSKETPAGIDPLVSPVSSSTEAPKTPSSRPPSTPPSKPPSTPPSTITSTNSLITNPYTFASTETPKKTFNLQEYYDTSEEDDYVTLSKLDIMKATTRPRVQWPVTQSIIENTNPTQLFPERKPTVQYFPPRAKPSTDDDINDYTPPSHSTVTLPQQFTESKSYPSRNQFPNEQINYASNEKGNQPFGVQHIQYRPVAVNKNAYLTQQPKLPTEGPREIPESYNRGFVIRHYKDLIDAAIKDDDYDRNMYPYTEQPLPKMTVLAEKTPVKSEEYDYDARKEVLDRFVDNFNQNHEQFKADFPVVFNTSIVHQHGPEDGKVLASSSAMFKRLYNDATATKANGFIFTNKPYDPNCENITVELSPAYELHYYVPDQEEREEQAVKVTIPYGYRI
ncbi:uncharacterized protein isoform X2 [Choristoneura fumiferana]|uniref:uncharacterized protein isoform X2 n=1 Tax=Choristoneura fumiferana TaxID=7141 RepID=UPI003D158D4A